MSQWNIGPLCLACSLLWLPFLHILYHNFLSSKCFSTSTWSSLTHHIYFLLISQMLDTLIMICLPLVSDCCISPSSVFCFAYLLCHCSDYCFHGFNGCLCYNLCFCYFCLCISVCLQICACMFSSAWSLLCWDLSFYLLIPHNVVCHNEDNTLVAFCVHLLHAYVYDTSEGLLMTYMHLFYIFLWHIEGAQ